MKITVRELELLSFEEKLTLEDGASVTIVEQGEWEQDHKSQSQEIIFTDDNKFYRGYVGRSGSYFSGWDYDSEIYGEDELADIDEVEKKDVVVSKWVEVK
ncbi:hypothetical protein [Oceanobacillus kimchii]|uniref:Uncharacterized protein n=1 Tax=Oceanobacillus kimchii TaxID=746691 RepID=A0ABQ5TIV3_9BACI|nr:hypothetical protein [Oceanobacillus kimchii]GLO66211.1 hypothetical protein MACH08_19950 [Oceanobacillus kimchii]